MLLLESTLCRDQVGRYSFLTADPFAFFELSQAELGIDPFAAVTGRLAEYSANPIAGLPPFQGGAAGLMSYELGHAWERLEDQPAREAHRQLPETSAHQRREQRAGLKRAEEG